ncbi:ATP-binding protein [Parachitinimonas caeni]|uniref:ATP-binding protein n=1 Tax=Parachitinimonas caeni TaxID=3031301 RepID=A0ABT7DVP5_9NEIS|nr:ATP-binding protein [Parachitinimonas caeni]MDK2124079.1 ATP-binding protein [Parachitinimonas caeni]
MPNALKHTLPCQLTAIAALAQDIERWGDETGLSAKLVFELNLMLDELITNIIEHGYAEVDKGTIEVSAENDAGLIVLVVRDNAAPFNLLDLSEPDLESDIEEREIGGLGVHFVRLLADSVQYRREADANIVTIRKSVNATLSQEDE